jgi:hypothetical protein
LAAQEILFSRPVLFNAGDRLTAVIDTSGDHLTAVIDTYLRKCIFNFNHSLLLSAASPKNSTTDISCGKIPQNSSFHVHSCSVRPGEVWAILKFISGKTWIAP